MNELFWYLKVSSPLEHLSAAALTLFIGFMLYQCDYIIIFARYLVLMVRHGSSEPTRLPVALPAGLVILPTLLRNEEELSGLQGAMGSAATNGYTGELHVVAAIDDGAHSGDLYIRLEAWIGAFKAPPGVNMYVTKTAERSGKVLAIEAGLAFIRAKLESGAIKEFPPLFYNMDADGRLGPNALAHMADRLLKPSAFTRKKPMIVASNVCIAPDTFWGGWRQFFSVRGQLSLLVAAEFLTAISIGKMNGRLIPVTNASGALYCTWSELHLVGPRWASFMQSLRLKSWLMWWVGVQPPRFSDHHGENPDAQTGPGDDTWMTWLALCARWENGKIVLELPRTPAHAFYYTLRSYLFRPLAYALRARIETKTPTTVKALFKQRVRWNSSRIQDVQRWRPALLYHWSAGVPVALSTALLLYVHGAVVISLFILPFVSSHGSFATMAFAYWVNMSIRGFSTAFALVVDGMRPKSGFKFLALFLWVPYNFVFNTLTTVHGCVQDIFGFGVNTKFSPESTHIRSRLSRIAIAYRLRRAFALTVRVAIYNDVPFGAFWFGWHETPWTPNGFEGWTTGRARVLLPRRRETSGAPIGTAVPALTAPATELVTAYSAPATDLVTAFAATASLRLVAAPPVDDVLRDSVRIRHVAAANADAPLHTNVIDASVLQAARESLRKVAIAEASHDAEAAESPRLAASGGMRAAAESSLSPPPRSVPPPTRRKRNAA